MALLAIYGTAPRGYAKGVLIHVPRDGQPQTKVTLWRLAPPRWFADIAYPHWTTVESGDTYIDPATEGLSSIDIMYRASSERHYWRGPSFNHNAVSARTSLTITEEGLRDLQLDYARSMLTALVRRQCRGFDGVWDDPDDNLFQASRDPWRFGPEEIWWMPP